LQGCVIEVRLDRSRPRDDRGLPHGDELPHLVAVREIPEGVALRRDDAGVSGPEGGEQLLERRPSVAHADTAGYAELCRERGEGRPERPIAEDLQLEAGNCVLEERDRADDGVESEHLLDRAVADQDEARRISVRAGIARGVVPLLVRGDDDEDRKSTRLTSSHGSISY